MVRAQRGDALAGPTVAVAGLEAIAVEKAGYQIVAGDQHQLAYGGDDVSGRAVALSASALLPLSIGASVDRILDHPVEGGVIRPSPGCLAIPLLHGKLKVLLIKPKQRLSRAAELLDFVEDQRDCRLHAPIGILLVSVAGLHEPTGAATTSSPRRALA